VEGLMTEIREHREYEPTMIYEDLTTDHHRVKQ
jgi:hypothetical protein